GTRIEKAAAHLNLLKQHNWKELLENKYHFPVILINDTDAVSLALANLGYLKAEKTVGIICIGTGLGFSVWRNGRRWRPGNQYTLLGSICTENESYNELASAS